MEYLLLLSSILAGAFTVAKLRLAERAHLILFNAFTGGYLLSITFLHLLPELYGEHGADPAHSHAGHAAVGGLILVGFFIQISLDVLSRGVEHGHSHPLHGHAHWGIMLGLCLHAFVEALALGDAQEHHDPASRRMLLISIVIHNYPVTIALLGMLLQSGMSQRNAHIRLGVFALMGPLGLLMSSHTALAHHSRILTAIVVGIFLHISTTILFESSDQHRFQYRKLGAIVVGTALGLVTVFLH